MNKEKKIEAYKICFIICSNNFYFLEECLFYISRLEVPLGYEVETISILDAKSMTSGYNEGMNATDAKYKIYLHQDVFILYKGFLQSILDIFGSDSNIGMIGMVGTSKMPVSGVMWHGHREGELYGANRLKGNYHSYEYCLEDGLYEVEAIDGLMMITCTDIPWKEDTFNKWDFYDVSQSFEFRKHGYKVVVPEQLCPWCKHDDGILNLGNYNQYRKICMLEYPEYFYPERFLVKKVKTDFSNNDKKAKKNICAVIIARNQFSQIKRTIDSIKKFSNLEDSQIVIVDNGSEDALRHWLKAQQNYSYLICGEVIEGYAAILNKVVKEFVDKQDLFILSPDLLLLPECLEILYNILRAESNIGAVCGRKILDNHLSGNTWENIVQYIGKHNNRSEKREISSIPFEAVLMRNEMLKQLQGFDESLLSPQYVMTDFAFQGKIKEYHYYEVQNAWFYKIADVSNMYLNELDNIEEKKRLIKKWEKYIN